MDDTEVRRYTILHYNLATSDNLSLRVHKKNLTEPPMVYVELVDD